MRPGLHLQFQGVNDLFQSQRLLLLILVLNYNLHSCMSWFSLYVFTATLYISCAWISASAETLLVILLSKWVWLQLRMSFLRLNLVGVFYWSYCSKWLILYSDLVTHPLLLPGMSWYLSFSRLIYCITCACCLKCCQFKFWYALCAHQVLWVFDISWSHSIIVQMKV